LIDPGDFPTEKGNSHPNKERSKELPEKSNEITKQENLNGLPRSVQPPSQRIAPSLFYLRYRWKIGPAINIYQSVINVR
jgi:hypothetical protein